MIEKIDFTDSRFNYYYKPWEISMTGEGPIIRTLTYNDYVDIWYLHFSKIAWYSERASHNGIAGFKIWGSQWEIQEMIDLYSPTRDSKIELILEREYPEDDYTVTLLNIGEKNPDAVGNYLPHAYFIIQ